MVGPQCKKTPCKYLPAFITRIKVVLYESIVSALLSPLHLKTNLIDLFSHCFSFMAFPESVLVIEKAAIYVDFAFSQVLVVIIPLNYQILSSHFN